MERLPVVVVEIPRLPVLFRLRLPAGFVSRHHFADCLGAESQLHQRRGANRNDSQHLEIQRLDDDGFFLRLGLPFGNCQVANQRIECAVAVVLQTIPTSYFGSHVF